ncbi:MAG: hypothetical protein ACYS21_05535 [Planctomycetota bacterium]|jgi:hypothetical protein
MHRIGIVQALGDGCELLEFQEDRTIDNALVPVDVGVGDGKSVSAAGAVVKFEVNAAVTGRCLCDLGCDFGGEAFVLIDCVDCRCFGTSPPALLVLFSGYLQSLVV